MKRRKSIERNGEQSAVFRTQPILSSPLSVSAVIVATLATIYALYVGKEVAFPIIMAVVLKLALQPVMDFLRNRLRIPAALSALILILSLFLGIATIAFTISGPTSAWIAKAPGVLPLLKEKLALIQGPLDYLQSTFKDLEEVTSPANSGPDAPAVGVKDATVVAGKLALGTLSVLARVFTTMVILFFFLAAGDRLLSGLIEVLPRLSDKRRAANIATELQRQIGGYLLIITLMNAAVGIVTGLVMSACGLSDPILWGAAVFLLNYIPILGPLTGVGMFLLVGIVSLDWHWIALLPACLYLLIHVCEGEIITPMLLANRFTLNPVLVIVSVFFWYAIWGVPGALLAVPILAMFKIASDRIEGLHPAGQIVGA